MRPILYFFVVVLLCSLPGLAQSPGVKVSSSLSVTAIPLDGTANLTVSVSGAAEGVDVPLPETRDGGLRFMPAGRRYQMTSVNGQMSSSTEYDFVVMPLKIGRHLIEPMTVIVNGVSHTTPSQRLEVTDMVGMAPASASASVPLWPSLPPQPREDDVLLESRVEPETVYKHQPVFHRLTLLSAVRLLSDPRYNAISPTGFLRIPFDQVNSVEERGGRAYDSSSITTAFFPLKEGDYTLPATQIQVTPGDLGLPRVLRTQPHAIKVLALPSQGRPKSFTGAVGSRFDLQARLRHDRVTVGNSVELEVQVEGDGHLELVPYPYLPEWENLDKKLGKSPSQTQAEQSKIHSERTYTYRLKPSRPGTYELKGLAFSFFNPQEQRYETLLAPTLSLQAEANPNAVDAAKLEETRELAESDRPAEEAGPSTARPFTLPWGHLGAGLVLMLFGALGGRSSRSVFWRRGGARKAKLGSHASLEELMSSLRTLAPGEDQLSRTEQLKAQGWSPTRIEALEALRRKTSRALFGEGAQDDALLTDLEGELRTLFKESKS